MCVQIEEKWMKRVKENKSSMKYHTLTKASRTSRACSMLRGVDTVSPLVIRVRLVRQFIRSLPSTWTHKHRERSFWNQFNQITQQKRLLLLWWALLMTIIMTLSMAILILFMWVCVLYHLQKCSNSCKVRAADNLAGIQVVIITCWRVKNVPMCRAIKCASYKEGSSVTTHFMDTNMLQIHNARCIYENNGKYYIQSTQHCRTDVHFDVKACHHSVLHIYIWYYGNKI